MKREEYIQFYLLCDFYIPNTELGQLHFLEIYTAWRRTVDCFFFALISSLLSLLNFALGLSRGWIETREEAENSYATGTALMVSVYWMVGVLWVADTSPDESSIWRIFFFFFFNMGRHFLASQF